VGEPIDVTGRPTVMRRVDLERFFRPRTLAVVGASDAEGRPNTGVWRRLRAWADEVGAEIHPVNPTRESVDGIACHASILDVPGEVDVAVLLVSDATAALADAIEKKARFAVIFAAGFAELGAAGRRAQDELARLVAGSDLHLLGPNTNLNAFESFRTDLPGPAIALITQSGHQGRPIFQAQEIGIAMAFWAPTGNEVDLEFADFVTWFADRDEVGVIAAYIEGFKDGRTLLLAADHAASRGVPIVCVKVGRTDEGASMAASHTGKLTGSDAVTSAVFRQAGITRVDGLDELLDTAQLLARAPSPPARGAGVCIYAISGGTGAHMADLCAAAGLPLPRLSGATQAQLYEWIPSYLRVSNPVDNGGHPVGDWRGRKILDALVADPDVGVLVCPITGAFAPMSDRLAQDLVDVAATTDKPVCVIWGSPVGTEDAYREILLRSSKVVTFRTFANCVTAVRAWFDRHEFQARRRSPFDRPVLRRARGAAAALDALARARPGGALSEHDSKRLLAAYDIAVTREHLAGTASEAARAATAIGYPVVVKACGAELSHKSDRGLVRVGLTSARQVREAFAELAGASAAGTVLVSELVDGGVEAVVGLAHDELFGPTVMAGLGGVLVEVLHDVAFRVPPFSRDEARRMVGELRGYPLLRGVRGRAPADVAALVDVIMKVQRMGVDLADELAELDVNPVVVRPRGQGAIALDALAVRSVDPVRG
jgi:acyl-CoA synthetase (NDP forming)